MDPAYPIPSPFPRRGNRNSHRIRTVHTELGPQLQSFNLPRRLFKWIYSVSLVILITLMLVLIAVTPIDVIIQTSSASARGVKLFIVIVVCVLFLVASFFLYFLRVYQHRVSMNDIPSKSVYIPTNNDLPKYVIRHITTKYDECQEVSRKAGPLYDQIAHLGLSPPAYIKRNGLLPPNLMYEDVVRSFGDKFTFHDSFTSMAVKLPRHFTMRLIIILMVRNLVDKQYASYDQFDYVDRMLKLYEKFKYGKQLITESEMVEFMVQCDKLGTELFHHYGSYFAVRKVKPRTNKIDGSDSEDDSLDQLDFYHDETDSQESQSVSSSDTSAVAYPNISMPYFYSRNSQSNETIGLVIRRNSSNPRLIRKTPSRSSHSSIKKKLSISGDYNRKSSSVLDLGLREHRSRYSVGNYTLSGYNSDAEREDEDYDHSSVLHKEIPQFQFTAAANSVKSRLPSPTKILDLEIRRQKTKRKSNDDSF